MTKGQLELKIFSECYHLMLSLRAMEGSGWEVAIDELNEVGAQLERMRLERKNRNGG